MNETEVEVTLESHRNEIGSLKHRMSDVEKIVAVSYTHLTLPTICSV